MYQYQALAHICYAKSQQDAILINDKVIWYKACISCVYQSNQFCVAVADGVATSPNAQLASKAVLKSVAKQFNQTQSVNFAQIQQDIINQLIDKPHYEGANSTLVCAYYHDDGIIIKNLGDSRAYLYQSNNKTWRQLTDDHAFINELKNDKDFDKNKEYASIYDTLTGYFCVDEFHELQKPNSYHIKMHKNDVLLLCSDGLHDELPMDKWLVMKNYSLQEWLVAMLELLKQNRSYDNVSMVVLKQLIWPKKCYNTPNLLSKIYDQNTPNLCRHTSICRHRLASLD